jgi:hypothetical protein
MEINNGVPTDHMAWRKSSASNLRGNCVELAGLHGGAIAVRNSRHSSASALVYTRAEIAAFIACEEWRVRPPLLAYSFVNP